MGDKKIGFASIRFDYLFQGTLVSVKIREQNTPRQLISCGEDRPGNWMGLKKGAFRKKKLRPIKKKVALVH